MLPRGRMRCAQRTDTSLGELEVGGGHGESDASGGMGSRSRSQYTSKTRVSGKEMDTPSLGKEVFCRGGRKNSRKEK